jgi:hypothetical protein
MLTEEYANRPIERIDRCKVIVENSEFFIPFLFPILIVADKYCIRLKIPVNILIYLKVILIKGTLGYAQTRSVATADPSIRTYGLSGDLLYLKFTLR